jgi:hypothetical protein
MVTCKARPDEDREPSCVTYKAHVKYVPERSGSTLSYTVYASGCDNTYNDGAAVLDTCGKLKAMSLTSVGLAATNDPISMSVLQIDECTRCVGAAGTQKCAQNIEAWPQEQTVTSSSSSEVNTTAFVGIGMGGLGVLICLAFAVVSFTRAQGLTGKPTYIKAATDMEPMEIIQPGVVPGMGT